MALVDFFSQAVRDAAPAAKPAPAGPQQSFASAQALADYARSTGATNVQNQLWWSDSPYKYEAWKILSARPKEEPVQSKEPAVVGPPEPVMSPAPAAKKGLGSFFGAGEPFAGARAQQLEYAKMGAPGGDQELQDRMMAKAASTAGTALRPVGMAAASIYQAPVAIKEFVESSEENRNVVTGFVDAWKKFIPAGTTDVFGNKSTFGESDEEAANAFAFATLELSRMGLSISKAVQGLEQTTTVGKAHFRSVDDALNVLGVKAGDVNASGSNVYQAALRKIVQAGEAGRTPETTAALKTLKENPLTAKLMGAAKKYNIVPEDVYRNAVQDLSLPALPAAKRNGWGKVVDGFNAYKQQAIPYVRSIPERVGLGVEDVSGGNKFYIHQAKPAKPGESVTGFEYVPAKDARPVEIMPGLTTFLHANPEGTGWRVSEAKTGEALAMNNGNGGFFSTPEQAIDAAKQSLAGRDPDEILAAVKDKVAYYQDSDLYGGVSPAVTAGEKDGRSLMEWENGDLTDTELEAKWRVAMEGNEDPGLIKMIEDDLWSRGNLQEARQAVEDSFVQRSERLTNADIERMAQLTYDTLQDSRYAIAGPAKANVEVNVGGRMKKVMGRDLETTLDNLTNGDFRGLRDRLQGITEYYEAKGQYPALTAKLRNLVDKIKAGEYDDIDGADLYANFQDSLDNAKQTYATRKAAKRKAATIAREGARQPQPATVREPAPGSDNAPADHGQDRPAVQEPVNRPVSKGMVRDPATGILTVDPAKEANRARQGIIKEKARDAKVRGTLEQPTETGKERRMEEIRRLTSLTAQQKAKMTPRQIADRMKTPAEEIRKLQHLMASTKAKRRAGMKLTSAELEVERDMKAVMESPVVNKEGTILVDIEKVVREYRKDVIGPLTEDQDRAIRRGEEALRSILMETGPIDSQAMKQMRDVHPSEFKIPRKDFMKPIRKILAPAKYQEKPVQEAFSVWEKKVILAKEVAEAEVRLTGEGGVEIGLPEIIDYQRTGENDAIRKVFDGFFAEARQRGLGLPYRKNYIPQVWANTEDVQRQALMRYLKEHDISDAEAIEILEGTLEVPDDKKRSIRLVPTFTKRRTFATYAEGMEYGLTPKYSRLNDLVAYNRYMMENTLANQELVEKLKSGGYLRKTDEIGERPAWKRLDAPFAIEYSAPTPLANMLNDLFRDDATLGIWGRTVKGAAWLSRWMQDVRLSGGIPFTSFNYFTVGQVIKEITAGVGDAVMMHPIRGAKTISGTLWSFLRSNSDKATQKWFERNQDAILELAKGGVRVDRLGTRLENGIDAIPAEWWKRARDTVGRGFDLAFNAKSFKNFMPTLYVRTYNEAKTMFLRKGMEEAEANKKAVEVVRAFHGMSEKAGRGKSTEEGLTAALFAPRFREGIINTYWNMARSLSTQLNNPAFYKNRSLFFGAIATLLVYDYLNDEMNGHHMWDNPDGRGLALRIPYGPGKEDVYYLEFMPSFMAFGRNMGQGFWNLAVTGNRKVAAQKLGGLFSMPLRLGEEVVTGEDYWGRQIGEDGENYPWAATKYAIASVMHPYLAEINSQWGKEDKDPWYASIGRAFEIPVKYTTESREEKAAYYDKKDKAAEERKEQVPEKLKESLSKQAKDRTQADIDADKLDAELAALPADEAAARFREIKKEDPQLAEKLKRSAADRKLGLTYEEKAMKSLGVENGARAEYIHGKIMELPAEDRAAYYKELRTKKVITDEVAKQIAKLNKK